jgi:hypothetical protein
VQPVDFRIRFAAHVGIVANIPTELEVRIQPKWRILAFSLQQVEKATFELQVQLHPDDVPRETPVEELRAFRDTVLAMLAVTAVTPLFPLIKGTYTFPLGNNKFEQRSLGPMQMEGPTAPLTSGTAIVLGTSATDSIRAVAYFIWQALNAETSLFRFIHLAICAQVIANAGTHASRAVHPGCPNPKCRYELAACPECGADWRIPTSFRDLLRESITDEALLAEFVSLRNAVFHGSLATLQGDQLKRIQQINKPLLVALRNLVASQVALPPVSVGGLALSGHDIDMVMSVYYTMPANGKSGDQG